jgi:hypothetical protein
MRMPLLVREREVLALPRGVKHSFCATILKPIFDKDQFTPFSELGSTTSVAQSFRVAAISSGVHKC